MLIPSALHRLKVERLEAKIEHYNLVQKEKRQLEKRNADLFRDVCALRRLFKHALDLKGVPAHTLPVLKEGDRFYVDGWPRVLCRTPEGKWGFYVYVKPNDWVSPLAKLGWVDSLDEIRAYMEQHEYKALVPAGEDIKQTGECESAIKEQKCQ